MSKLISVIIPCYNHSLYIKETIESIIKQSYSNIELIIIDDGSTDDSFEKIKELEEDCQKRFANVIFKKHENKGVCDSLNELISLSSGDYVYLIASDDIAQPQAVEKLYNFLSSNEDYSLVVGDNQIIDSDSRVCFWDKNRNIVYDEKQAKFKTFSQFLSCGRKDVNFKSKDFGNYPSIVEMNYIPNGYLIRKSIFEKIGLFTNDAPLEDYFLMMQIAKYSKIKYIDEILFSYRWHGSNTVKQNEKILKLIDKTRFNEKELIKRSDVNNFNQDIQNYIKFGKMVIRIGVPFFVEIYKVKNIFFKKTYLRVLGVNFTIKSKTL